MNDVEFLKKMKTAMQGVGNELTEKKVGKFKNRSEGTQLLFDDAGCIAQRPNESMCDGHAKKDLNVGVADGRKAAALAWRGLVVVIGVAFVLILYLTPALNQANQTSSRVTRISNLKEIGSAYRNWVNDSFCLFPALSPQTNGAWHYLLHITNTSAYTWTNYVKMASEFGQSPVILVCPADEGKTAKTVINLVTNNNTSHFVGVNASDAYPQSLLGGDCNLETGIRSDTQHGYSSAKRLRSLEKRDGRAAQTSAIKTALEPDFSDASDPILKTAYATSFVVLFGS